MISDEKFEKKDHLLKPRDFKRTYEKGFCIKKEKLFLYGLPNGLDNNRIGFSIGSRYVKLSTRRNKIRRFLRETYRRNKKAMKTGYDIVVVVKKDLDRTQKASVREKNFLQMLKIAKILES